MPTVAFVSSKGGTGKTTAALLLALALEHMGKKVSIIDADPNLPLYGWRKKATYSNIRVFPAMTIPEMMEVIPLAQARSEWLVVDTEGSARACAFVEKLQPDLALVPVGPSALEVEEAVRTSNTLRNTRGRAGPFIPHACILTRMPAALRPRSLNMVLETLRNEKISLIETPIVEKEAFRAIFSMGGSLHTLDDTLVTGLPAARLNAEMFANTVMKVFNQMGASASAA